MPAIVAAFDRDWPEASLANLLDDSLSADLAREGALTPAMTERFLTLSRYAKRCGADAILFTCSAFGPCIEACARDLAPLPVLKPNEAMIEEAVALAGPSARIGLLATFAPTARVHACGICRRSAASDGGAVPGGGGVAGIGPRRCRAHDRAAAEAATALRDCDVVVLGQFSLARAAPLVAEATGKTVLTTPDSAVRKLKNLLIPAAKAA